LRCISLTVLLLLALSAPRCRKSEEESLVSEV
jgi:hypothetical protein